MKDGQKGFALVEGLLLVVVVVLVCAVSYLVYSNQKDAQASNSTDSYVAIKDQSDNAAESVARSNSTNPGFVTVTEWGIAVRIGKPENASSITYRIGKDEYGDDSAYFLIKEDISKNCREIGFALHRKLTEDNGKYAKIGDAYYAPSAATSTKCETVSGEEKAVGLLRELTASLDAYDYEIKESE